MNIEIINKKSDLSQEVFIFHLSEHPLRLQLKEYYLGERKTNHHNFQAKQRWLICDKTNNTISNSEIPLTDDIRNQAKIKLLDFLADITVS